MKKNILSIFTLFLMLISVGINAQKTYNYESHPNDKMGTRIYTLDNGLKVYMSVNKEEPRIQAYVAVRVGGKHDPSETTGLAHYFEHMMFKGTPNFGTINWEKEKVLIDEIEQLFEIYRVETDQAKRNELYRKIDSISYIASTYAIPNEYDKIAKAIGSQGTNAATSYDATFYIENIPSNQLENWAILQADRFTHPVLRLFHTELETVYEEKNMSLTNDGRKVIERMFQVLFPNHPYGQQTVLGEAEHLKNPSMKNIREFFEKYYIPNNMAVILAGDFNPDEAIITIDKHFGTLKTKPVPEFSFKPEPPKTKITETEVIGLEAENLMIAYRFPGIASDEALFVNMMAQMLFNQKAGIIDLNINQKQLALSGAAFPYMLGDYSALVLSGRPKAGQTLEELRILLIEQIDELKKGNFPDWMLEAAINNMKLQEMKQLESNSSRTRSMMNMFLHEISLERSINYIDRISKITKEELVNFANKNLQDNYVVIYKRQGTPPDIESVAKPPITPIHLNRDAESDFFKKIKANKVPSLEPVFVDFNKDIKKLKSKNKQEILYVENKENNTFNLYFHYDIGSWNDNILSLAVSYLPYLGTSKMSAEQIQQEFYKLACTFSVSTGNEETYISISGLSDNFEAALKLAESIVADPVANPEALKNLIADILKSRNDAKTRQQSNFAALTDYAVYGKNSPGKYFLTEEELNNIKPEQLINTIKKLNSYPHRVLYYGNLNSKELVKQINKNHKTPKKFIKPAEVKEFKELPTDKNVIYFAEYNANQSNIQLVTKSVSFDKNLIPIVSLYNSYFGGSMNAIVFQEMREKRSLAYTARSTFRSPSKADGNYMNFAFIATQNDKAVDAIEAFNELFDNMPLSENAFNLAKDGIKSRIETERITKTRLLFTYLSNRRLGLEQDTRKDIYFGIENLTIDDVKKFSDKYLKDQTKTYIILGREKEIDFDSLKKYGEKIKLTQEEIFGY